MTLTRQAVCDLVEYLAPQDGEVVLLVFVRREDGRYIMAAPIPCSWQEMIAAIAHKHGIIPEVTP